MNPPKIVLGHNIPWEMMIKPQGKRQCPSLEVQFPNKGGDALIIKWVCMSSPHCYVYRLYLPLTNLSAD